MSPSTRATAQGWLRDAAAVAIAALVAYFTTTGAIQAEIAGIKATQASQFEALKYAQEQFQGEVLRRIDALHTDLRELRARSK